MRSVCVRMTVPLWSVVGRTLQGSNLIQIVLLVTILKLSLVETVILTPPYFNLAEGRKITATATCGEDTQGPELYCKLVGANAETDANVIQGQVCDVCDPTRKDKMHPPEFAVDGYETWWQSPPLSRGMKYNEVNLTIDLGQEFHVAYVYIRMGNSPRPGLWALEKSSDYGETYTPWQYFSDSPGDCETYFGKESLSPITKDDSVVCNTEYSKIVPLENGEIPISLLNNRPSANHYFNSSVLQEWTRATNVRFRLLRTKNLLGHLMSVARQDPTVTRRYFYSIKDISIGGRCMCNGHADTCDIQDSDHPTKLLCRCQHHTCGPQCAQCCPGFEQKAWRQSKASKLFVCEPCNCHNHTDECIYDADIDAKHQSLDIHGKYEGGGVCQNCKDNTEGINCDQCKARFFRPYGKYKNETDVCQPCNCNESRYTGNCAEETGQCQCRPEFTPPDCSSCSFGHFGYPNCRPCECHLNGTDGNLCEAVDGKCPCKVNYDGDYCNKCAEGYYNFPDCIPCECGYQGSLDGVCDSTTGQCSCKSSFGGRTCDQCKDGYHNYPTCAYCKCDNRGTIESICNKTTGECLCQLGYSGEQCDQCVQGYYGYPECIPCGCSTNGASSTVCDITGKCPCASNFAGRTCEQCSPGYYKYPECLPCYCDSYGSNGVSCNSEGQCNCKSNFDNTQCNQCKEGFYNFPNCEECNCDPAGVVAAFAGCGSVPAGELCQCKERVHGRICDICRPLYWNLSPYNPDGCEDCNCHVPGTVSGIGVCDGRSGQCICKASVTSRTCSECEDGSYNLSEDNLFGCTDCGCDVGGSVNGICDKGTGQCECHPRITGRNCQEPRPTYYFPTLYQYQFEVEDGYTPARTVVRHANDERKFPDYSWRGYAVFSALQDEIIQNVHILKSSVYRMVLFYVNPNPEPVVGTITIKPDNPSEIEQTFLVLFKPTTKPEFVTVSKPKENIPSPFVMNPGNWDVHIKTDKSLFVDYFVLLPAAFYEATILTRKVETPCQVGQMGLCRHHHYPNISEYNTVYGTGAYVGRGGARDVISQYFDDSDQLRELKEDLMPVINSAQPELSFELTITKPGRYVLVFDYISPKSDPRIAKLQVEVSSMHDRQSGKVDLYPCTFSTPCRQVVTDSHGRVAHFHLDANNINVIVKGENNANVGLKLIAAIPLDKWSLDYIRPASVCVRKDGKCVQATYPKPPESKKIEFEEGNEGQIAINRPADIFDNSSKLILLDEFDKTVDIQSTIPAPGHYVIIVQYYQPDYPEFDMNALIHNGQVYAAKLPVKHCPSNSGCRAVIKQADGNDRFSLTENFILTLTEPNKKRVWLDFILMVPADQYSDALLQEDTFDQTREFISTCGGNHFNVNLNATGFCRDSVFSLTADYNNGALPCHCDYEGSKSFKCELFGGQCKCKPNIIGRKCEACRTGFYGFPDCKPCNCPSTALCEKDTGKCICPPNVKGEKCDECEDLTYGFDPLTGCEDCNCHRLGVQLENEQCDRFTGFCTCKENVKGRACDHCVQGYYSFPYCDPCECDTKGTTPDICDQTSAECFCKANVEGPACDICKEGTFNIQESNDEGCTKCFCFGKTSRCVSSSLYRIEIMEMSNWRLDIINQTTNDISIQKLDTEIQVFNATVISVDLEAAEGKTVYFRAPIQYLGNKLTAYGGLLIYTVFYTTGLFGSATSGADVILYGGDDIYLLHEALEQPPANTPYQASLELVESKFILPSRLPATREQIMSVLEDLQGIYIRATYWESSIISRLQDVSLDIATDEYYKNSVKASSVEQCLCPPNYSGLSCEDCALGYYRATSGPHGGYCVPCQCNGHSEDCDVNTGVCIDCQHSTTGDHCEQCIVGYHGNATLGTPIDCLICACPLPYASNNFAQGCQVSPDGDLVSCNCDPGYYGGRCESCAAGFYGNPEERGDYCKPCQCHGNINPDDFGSCDSVTGECLRCLNNTFGAACNLCAPGFYGDAIENKDCQSCICDKTGTEHCDSYTGICECYPNVVGDKCDRCVDDHYAFNSQRGCLSCDCAEASESSQCDDDTGNCRCKPGVAGRRCDRCALDFWNYGPEGCSSCECNTEYSVNRGCNAETGQCECLPGVIGDKCDECPYRWVLIQGQGCFECNTCIDDLLDFTDALENTINPFIREFKTIATGYFTAKRIVYINQTINELRPAVALLNPAQILLELNPLSQEIDRLDQDQTNLKRRTEYASDNAKDNVEGANALVVESEKALNAIRVAAQKTRATVNEVDQLATSLESGESRKREFVLGEGNKILDEIQGLSFKNYLNETETQLVKAEVLLKDMKKYAQPVLNQSLEFEKLREEIADFDRKLNDLRNRSEEAQNVAIDAEELTLENQNAVANSKVETVKTQAKEAFRLLEDGKVFLKNATDSFEDLKASLHDVDFMGFEIATFKNQLSDSLDLPNDLNELIEPLQNAQMYADELESTAQTLRSILDDTKNTSDHAVRGATAYKNIVTEIETARRAVGDARLAVQNATDLSEGLDDRAGEAESKASELLNAAKFALTVTQTQLKPELEDAIAAVDEILLFHGDSDDINNDINESLDKINADPLDAFANQAKSIASKAQEKAVNALGTLSPIVVQLPDDVVVAQKLAKDVDETKKAIVQTNTQMEQVNKILPDIDDLMNDVTIKQDKLNIDGNDILDKINKLKQQIADARFTANSIKVGVKFIPNTTLELKPPQNIPLLATSTRASTFFRTAQPNGFLMYLGNEVGTGLRRTKRDDFMALEVHHGKPVLTIDLGNGVEKIVNDKYVADNQWYQVIVERTGKNVKLIIREEIENGDDKVYEKEQVLPGTYSILNLDADKSKLFVGGYPSTFAIQDDVGSSSFEGEIEDLVIGDTPVGLWNFVDGEENTRGAVQRDKLIEIKEQSVGYRFNGNGYVELDSLQYNLKIRSDIAFSFKADRDSRDGLLFVISKDKSFLSIEMRNGRIFYKYRTGINVITLGSDKSYNDGQWHRIVARRDGRQGVLVIDDVKVADFEPKQPDTSDILQTSDVMYFGGCPNQNIYVYNDIINAGFDGCIDKVFILGTPVDLSRNIISQGVRPGCPAKFARIISFNERYPGYLRRSNVSADNFFQINLKFKTSVPEGLIFYATNHDQSSVVSLSIMQDGVLVFKSQKQELTSGAHVYNDREWHVVTATHESDGLRLDVDDYDHFSNKSSKPLRIQYGDLYIAGLPSGYAVPLGTTATIAPFGGCLGDATINGAIINFANATDKVGQILGRCILDDEETDLPIDRPDRPYPEIDLPIDRPDRPYPEDPLPDPTQYSTTTGRYVIPTERYPIPDVEFTTHRLPPDEPDSEVEITDEETTPHAEVITDAPTLPPQVTTQVIPDENEIDVDEKEHEARPLPPTQSPKEECRLLPNPALDVGFESGYRFGLKLNSRLKFDQLPARHRNKYDFSIDFKTDVGHGVIFYAANQRHTQFVALYMIDGKIHYAYQSVGEPVQLISDKFHADGFWHTVVFSRTSTTGKLTIDDALVGAGDSPNKSLSMAPPYYLGGVDIEISHEVKLNIEIIDTFEGCLRNFMMNGFPVGEPNENAGVIPCSDQVEQGMFFKPNGGYLKVKERFKVGQKFNLKMDIKPRHNTGLLVSVQGKKDYLILQMTNGTLSFTVDNGKGPMTANYKNSNPNYFCDGNWHTIEAVKIKYVVSLIVDNTSVEPAIDTSAPLSTDTSRPLFIGGHPYIKVRDRVRGLKEKQPYYGCIRNLEINQVLTPLTTRQASGNVEGSVCPTN